MDRVELDEVVMKLTREAWSLTCLYKKRELNSLNYCLIKMSLVTTH